MALTGKTNAEKIWNYCMRYGLNEFGAAGLMGNLWAESGLEPNNLQNSYQDKLGFTNTAYTSAVDNGLYSREQFIGDKAGFGLAQWTHSKRKANLYDFAKSSSASIGELEMQLCFLMKELRDSYPAVLSTLKTAENVRQASDAVLLKFERPADMSAAAQIKRANFGQKYYTEFVTNKQIGGVENMGYVTTNKGKKVTLSDHFKSTEFDCHGKGCCTQTLINEQLVDYLEKVRKHFGKPVNVNSGYRCSVHNQNIGGAKNSRHSRGDAADISIKGVEPREVAKFAESIGVMGIGLYETSSDGRFVHIDTRTKKFFWYGQKEEPRTTFGGSVATDNMTTQQKVRVLKVGCEGDDVKDLQEKLIKLGYSCGGRGADGEFGPKTEIAVRRFQDAKHLKPIDGIVGSVTSKAIDDAIHNGFFPNDAVVVMANILNVREGAGINYPVIGTVRKGLIITLSDVKDGWGKLKGKPGWVSLQYCQKK